MFESMNMKSTCAENLTPPASNALGPLTRPNVGTWDVVFKYILNRYVYSVRLQLFRHVTGPLTFFVDTKNTSQRMYRLESRGEFIASR